MVKVEETFSFDVVNNIKHEEPRDFVLFLPHPSDVTSHNKNKELKSLKVKANRSQKTFQKPKSSKDKFHCDLCPFSCQMRHQITSHVSHHVQLGTFPCHSCGSILRSKYSLNYHLSKTHSCKICGDDFVCIVSLNKHVKAAHTQKVFTCETCNKSYKLLNSLRKHEMYNQHGSYEAAPGTKFLCNQCPYEGKSKYHLNKHKHVHNKQFECSKCEKRFAEKITSKYHEAKCNGIVEIIHPFPCNQCSKSYKTEKCLKSHRNSIHSGKRFQCDHCSEIFNDRTKLRYHILNHFKVLCKDCGKSFNRIALRIHIEGKHGTKKFECDLCLSKFKRKLLLRDHFKRMHPKGNYTCLLCREKFEKINDLIQHQRTHIGRRHWKCLKCKFETESNYELKRHHASKHRMHRVFLKKDLRA